MKNLLSAMDKRLVASCHDLSEGGLFVSISEMCFGGDIGVDLDLSKIGDLRTDVKLFSESNGRWIVEVEKKKQKAFEKIVKGKLIGKVSGERKVNIIDGKTKVSWSLDALRDKWNNAVIAEVPK